MAARASRLENQDAIDAAIVGMLMDPMEVYASMEFFNSKSMIFFNTTFFGFGFWFSKNDY